MRLCVWCNSFSYPTTFDAYAPSLESSSGFPALGGHRAPNLTTSPKYRAALVGLRPPRPSRSLRVPRLPCGPLLTALIARAAPFCAGLSRQRFMTGQVDSCLRIISARLRLIRARSIPERISSLPSHSAKTLSAHITPAAVRNAAPNQPPYPRHLPPHTTQRHSSRLQTHQPQLARRPKLGLDRANLALGQPLPLTYTASRRECRHFKTKQIARPVLLGRLRPPRGNPPHYCIFGGRVSNSASVCFPQCPTAHHNPLIAGRSIYPHNEPLSSPHRNTPAIRRAPPHPDH